MKRLVKSWLSNPLIRFILGGIIVFGLHDFFTARPDKLAYGIIVDPGQILRLQTAWEKEKRRPPTKEELKNLIAAEVEEEILYREALQLGLDQGDRIVKRRLVQKYRFMLSDTVIVPQPDEIILEKYYERHAARYRTPERLSFDHIFFSTANRIDPYRDAAAEFTKLPRVDTSATGSLPAGDSFWGPSRMKGVTQKTVHQMFGPGFFNRVKAVETGQWSIPLKSVYGWHLVRINEKTPEELQTFNLIRKQVLADWHREKRREATSNRLKTIRKKYRVETPDEFSGTLAAAGDQP